MKAKIIRIGKEDAVKLDGIEKRFIGRTGEFHPGDERDQKGYFDGHFIFDDPAGLFLIGDSFYFFSVKVKEVKE